MRRSLHRRYGHTGGRLASAYTHRQSPSNALDEIVYRADREVGKVTLRGSRRWYWTILGRSYSGYTRTMLGGVKKVAEAVEEVLRRQGA